MILSERGNNIIYSRDGTDDNAAFSDADAQCTPKRWIYGERYGGGGN